MAGGLGVLHRVDAAGRSFPNALRQRLSAFRWGDRKSTRLNSSHLGIAYAVFCLKKSNSRRRYSLSARSCSLRMICGAVGRMARGGSHYGGTCGPAKRARVRVCPASFFNDTAAPEIYPLSLHGALPI